jgi:putative tryptophan/tyrosine transport system substrate-binding protein
VDRRAFVLAALAAAASGSRAQPRKPWRVGYLSMAAPHADLHWVEAFREGLRELGYVEGRNLVLEQRHAGNDPAKVYDLAADLIKRDITVLVIYGSPAIAQLNKQAPNLPIVMTVHADPVGAGVVASLARPGGNITGLTDGHADLAPKRLELLKEVVPALRRVGVLFNPASGHAVRQWKLVDAAGPSMGVSVAPIEVKGSADIERSFDQMRRERVEGVVFAPDPTWWVGQERRTASLAIQNRLPAIASVREFAEHGILLAYGTNFSQLWRKSASYVDKILKGAKPGELPIEHPNRFDLGVNLKTAAALGIRIPRAFVLRADYLVD